MPISNILNFKFLTVFFIILTSFAVFFDLTFADRERSQKIKEHFIKTVKLPGLVRSVNYFDHRFIEYKDYSNIYLPGVSGISTMDMVYE